MVRFIKTHKKFSAVVFVMLVLIVLRANSYRIALHVSGLAETERIYTFAADRHSPWVGSHGNEVFRIIFSANNNGEFVMLRRNFFGIWRVQSRNSARCPSTGSLTYLWTTGIPGTHNLLINYVYHNPRISFSDNMRAHIRPYMWFQVCDAVSHGRTSARVIPCQNASYYIFHFSAEGGEAFNALAPIDYSVDLVVAQVANWVDMVKNPWHPVIDLKKYGECEPVEPLPERRAVTGSVLINNHPTLFHAYEINDELFFAISDVSAALQRTQARFWHQDFFISYDFDFHIFNERVYARLADILTLPFNKPQLTQIRDLRMSIDTNEPYVSEYHRQLAADFMVSAYPHLFTRESIPRYFEFYCGDGYCHPLLTYVIDFHLFDFGDGIPAIGVRYAPPGSGS
ncbi:MAG: hypothetical protein FWC32_00150, partial [Firmicutes bacterium]|nr:hypothetical protein [Bacillota bacterium]